MKTKLLFAMLLSVAAASGVFAQGAGQAGKAGALRAEKESRAAEFAQRRDEIDVIQRGVLDLEAQYWAWDIQNLKRTTYEELSGLSKRWIIKPGTREELFVKIRQRLDAGRVPALTGPEQKRYDEAKEKIRRILSPGRYDKAAIDSVTLDYCIDLSARYWAKRIQGGETEILENARTKWGLGREVRARLVAAIEAKVKEDLEYLTREELYKHDACGAKLHGR